MKNGDMSAVYGILAFLSALLFISYIVFSHNKNRLFTALFGCVCVSNTGYFLLAVCRSLAVARFAGTISYFGGAFSILLMLLIIFEVCKVRKRKWLTWLLVGVSLSMFLLAASGDWLGLYYRSITLESIDGMTHLVKEYGPLHGVYAVYLLSYVLIMAATIIYSGKEKRVASLQYTLFLLVAVLLNVGVWLVEKFVDVNFEFLSVSYMVTAVLLLLIHGMLVDYGIIRSDGAVVSVQMLTQLNTRQVNPGELPPEMDNLFRRFSEKIKTLSKAERRILDYYIEGYESAQIPNLAYVSIHTVKKHNRSIYQKLEISSRDELMLYIELFRCCNRLDELIGGEAEEL